MNMTSSRGSLSIFLCLVTGAAVLLVGTFAHAARIRAAEHDIKRGLSAQIQTTLARYDRDLRQFGLFAFTPGSVDPRVFKATLNNELNNCEAEVIFDMPITDSDILERQVIRHMKTRLPAIYAQLLVNRLSSVQKGISEPLTQSLSIVNGAKANETAPTETQFSLDTYLNDGFSGLISQFTAGVSDDALEHTIVSLFGDLAADLEDELISQTEQLYRQLAAEYAGNDSDQPISQEITDQQDIVHPDVLSGLAASLDQLLNFRTAPVYEKACLIEYVLAYFRPAVTRMGQLELKTPDGRPFSEFSDKRKYEVEQIIAGQTDPQKAQNAVKSYLVGLRCIINLIWILTDQDQVNKLQSAAAAISAALLITSGGTVAVESKIIYYMLVVGSAINNGNADYSKLYSGRAVYIWPGKSSVNLPLYYQDYLRLFLLIMPRASILERTGKLLAGLFPEPLYTRLEVAANFQIGRASCRGRV